MSVQAISAAWLIYRLKGRYPLRMAGRDAMKNLSKFLGPTGEDACWLCGAPQQVHQQMPGMRGPSL